MNTTRSIRAAEDVFLSDETLHRVPESSSPRSWYMSWLRYLHLANFWIASLAEAVYIRTKQSPKCDGLTAVLPTELRR